MSATFNGVFYEVATVNGREHWRMGETISGRTSVGEWVETTQGAMREMAERFATRLDATFLGRKVHNGYLPD
jgi:hypothetical protein